MAPSSALYYALTLFQDVLIVTTDAWMAPTPSSSNVRSLARVFAVGIKPKVQDNNLQTLTDNPKRNFLIDSNQLKNYGAPLQEAMNKGLQMNCFFFFFFI